MYCLELTEMLPSIMNQLGAENVWSLKNLANTLKNAADSAKATTTTTEEAEDDEDVPQLVENFEETAKNDKPATATTGEADTDAAEN